MSTSVPVCDDEYGLYGMPWPEILDMRDHMAWLYYERFRQRIPLEEFVSAGNLAIATARHTFPHATSGVAFRPYLGRTIINRYKEIWHVESRKVTRGTVTGLDMTRFSSSVAYDRRHDAGRLLRYAETVTTPRNAAMLRAWLAGDSDDQIARRTGLSQNVVSRMLRKLLCALQAWAWQGEGPPPLLLRHTTLLTPHDKQTITRLSQAGMSNGALRRRFGCDLMTIKRTLRHAQDPTG